MPAIQPLCAQEAAEPAARRAFFGELHLHTTMSFDAWTFGTKVTPDLAYKFARGETVMVPPYQLVREQGRHLNHSVPAKRAWPLDFAAVTDHAEFMGALTLLDHPDSAFAKSDLGKQLRPGGRPAFAEFVAALMGHRTKGTAQLNEASRASNAWAIEVKAANDNYEPGVFTTFIGYEWTATPRYTMHRNVIFDSNHAPAPFTSLDSEKPEDLWKYLDAVRAQGIPVLAIPHNSNMSDGHDFDWNMSNGKRIDAAYALERSLNEPLVEIAQTKGASETRPELSPEDEFADFEIMDRVYPGETSPATGGSYVRDAYGRGLIIQSRVGANPYKMGVVGGSDIHNGLSASDENDYAGGVFGLDAKTMLPSRQAARKALGMSGTAAGRGDGHNPIQFGSAAITGVWAEENTRDSIFAALKRKETFATSGVRIGLRMFGAWNFDSKMLKSFDWVKAAYAGGVPMGSDLPARPNDAKAPTFVVWAIKDPDGANLDRIQVVKLWLAGDAYEEKVFDVALSDGRKDDPKTAVAPAVGNTVDLETGAFKNTIGAPMLEAVWTDPEFDPKTTAVYYMRVLQIPTARWSTYLAIKSHLPLPAGAPATIQERGWSSPIWYTPDIR